MLVVPHLSPPMMMKFGIAAWALRRRRRALLRAAAERARARAPIAASAGSGGSGGGKVCVSVSGTSVASLAAMPDFLVQPPVADLGSSLEHFFDATTEFFRHLSE